MTHWKKNIDSNFISGEDLMTGLHGLKPEMPVIIAGFNDDEAFDQKKNAKMVVTGIYLTDLKGNKLHRPVVLNKTNGRIIEKEAKSAELEDWIGVTLTMFAEKSTRFGHVVRFKRYVLPTLTVTHEKFAAVKKAIADDPANLAIAKQKYNISADVEAALLAK